MPASARLVASDLGAALLLRVVEPGLEEDIRQERIVHLHQESGRYDRPVFLIQLDGERVKVLLVGLVILVNADAGGRCCRQERVAGRYAGRLCRGLYVVDVDLQELLAAILDRPDADDRRVRNEGAAHHRLLEILRVVLRKRRDLLLEQDELLVRPRFETLEPLLDVGEKSGLGELAVGDNIDAAFDLFADAVGDGLGQQGLEFVLVVRLLVELGLHDVEQIVRSGQAADVRGLDTVGVVLNSHEDLPGEVRIAGRGALRPAARGSRLGYPAAALFEKKAASSGGAAGGRGCRRPLARCETAGEL